LARAAATKRPATAMIAALTSAPMTMKLKPRTKNLPLAWASPTSMNCGRKVTKNRMIFGLVRLISSPVR
jgi:hypothetical protein